MNDGGQRKNMVSVMTSMAAISLDASCLLTNYRHKHFFQTLNSLCFRLLKESGPLSNFR